MSELYVLTDSNLTPPSTLLAQVEAALAAGVRYLQYRDKSARFDLDLLSNLKKLCFKFECKLIIDDDPYLAREIGADGVHIGADDVSLETAREILGAEAIIGVSCYASLERALAAQAGGASYAAFGAMYPSSTKPAAPLCPHEIVSEAKSRLNIPVCVIGGINEGNIAKIAALHPDLVAIVGAAWAGGDAGANISNLKAKMGE